MKINAIVENRLRHYQKQARTFCSSSTTKQNLRNSALMSITPLAAMSLLPLVADGQCTPNTPDNILILESTNGCIKDVRIDLDGDGDFDVRLEANAVRARLRASNNSTMSFVGGGSLMPPSLPFLSNLGYGENVPGTHSFVNTAFSYILSTRSGQGNFYPTGGITPVTGYIGFNMGGQHGFLEITVSKLNDTQGQSSCITIGDFGVETAGTTIETGVCASLPVELLNFTAKTRGEAIQLEWKTASEIQNSGFELERSLDTKIFRKIAWIPGNNTTVNTQMYTYKDEAVKANETYFYRLKQIDEDGMVYYSEIVSALYDVDKQGTQVEVFPNPAQAYIQMRIDALIGGDAKIDLFNHTGTLIHAIERIPLQKGMNHLGLSALELPAGTYFLKIEIGEELVYKQVVVL